MRKFEELVKPGDIVYLSERGIGKIDTIISKYKQPIYKVLWDSFPADLPEIWASGCFGAGHPGRILSQDDTKGIEKLRKEHKLENLK